MAEDLISNYIDRTAFKEDTNFAVSEIEGLVERIKTAQSAIKTSMSTIGVSDNVAQRDNLVKEATKNIAAQTVTIRDQVKAKKEAAEAEKQNNKALIEAEQLEQQRLKTQKLRVQADNEVIKQINLEAEAELKVTKAKEARERAEAKLKSKPNVVTEIVPGSVESPDNSPATDADVAAWRKLQKAEVDAITAAQEYYGTVAGGKKITDEQSQSLAGVVLKYDQYTGSLQGNLIVQTENANALKANKEQQKLLEKEMASSVVVSEAQVQKMAALKSEAAQLGEANKLLTATIRAQAKESVSAEGSLDQMASRLAALQATYASFGEAQRSSKFGTEIKAEIDKLDPAVKELDAELGKFQRNVGNYPKAAAASVAILEQEIEKINNQLKTTAAGTSAFDKLTKEAELLKSVAAGLSQPFTSTKQELRALDEAAKKVGTQFGLTSEQFERFATEVGARKDEIGDLQKAINFKASDTKALDATVQGVQAIVGAYGAYQAVVAITGEENEELAKSMQKLQAALTLVTSVQAIANSLQSESALVQGILAAKTTLLTLAEKAATFATGERTAAYVAQGLAMEASTVAAAQMGTADAAAAIAGGGLTIVATETAAAMTGEAVAAEGLAASLGTVAGAEGAVAAGAVSMSTAIAATGIGLLIIGISIAVYKLVSAIREQNLVTESIGKANEAYAKSIKSLIDATKEFDSVSALSTKRQLENMEKMAASRKLLGVTSAQAYALDKVVAEARLEDARKTVASNKITEDSVAALEKKYIESARSVQTVERLKQDYIEKVKDKGNKDFERQIGEFDKLIALKRDELEANKSVYDLSEQRLREFKNAQMNVYNLTLNEVKENADERRKIILETSRLEAEITIDKNNRILNSEYTTLDQKLVALKSNLKQQKKIIEAENKAIQDDPTISESEKALSEKKTQADISKVVLDGEIKRKEIKENYRLRELAAITEMNKLYLQSFVETNEAILNSDTLTEEERLNGLRNSMLAKKGLIEADLNEQLSAAGISDENIQRLKKEGIFEIKNKKITDEELKKMLLSYNLEVLKITKDAAAKRAEIVKNSYQIETEAAVKSIEDIQAISVKQEEDKYDTYVNQTIALNDQFSKRLISQKDYNEKKKALDKEYAVASLKIEIDNIEKALEKLKEAKDVEIKLQTEINNLKKIVGPETDDQKEERARKIKGLEDILSKVKEVTGKESELWKKLADLRLGLSTATINSDLTALEKYAQGLEKFASKVKVAFSVVSDALNAVATAQKNKLQDQQDEIDKTTARQIEAVNAEVGSEQDKAAKIEIIQARAQAKKEELALRQRKIDQDNAKAQKAMTIFTIMLTNTINIVKALKNPLELAFAIAMGAAQLAIAIATPIPKFAKGKTSTYEGPAIVGDGKVPEYIHREDGTIEKTPATDTLTYLKKRDIVYPNHAAMLAAMAMPKIRFSNTSVSDFTGIEMAIREQRPLLSKIANKRENHIKAGEGALTSIWKMGANRTKYFNENTNW